MSKFLKSIMDLEAFQNAINNCKEEVWLRKNDGTEEFNLKSVLSRYIALGKLADEHGDEYEVFCASLEDEANLLKYFYEHSNM